MNSLFSYSRKNSVIHRCPAWIKLVLLLAVPITVPKRDLNKVERILKMYNLM